MEYGWCCIPFFIPEAGILGFILLFELFLLPLPSVLKIVSPQGESFSIVQVKT